MDIAKAVMVSGFADNADKAYWLATAYALGNPRTRGIGKAMLSYGVRVSANVAYHSTKGVVKGIARTPFKRGGTSPAKAVGRYTTKRAVGKGATKMVPVIGSILLAYDVALVGGYVMSKHVPQNKEHQQQLGKLLMHPTGR